MLSYFNNCILCFTFCFYASVNSMVKHTDLVGGLAVADQVTLTVDTSQNGEFERSHYKVDNFERGYSDRNQLCHTSIIIENKQLKNPIHVWGNFIFKFSDCTLKEDKNKWMIRVFDDKIISQKDYSSEGFSSKPYDKKTQYFIIFSYRSKYHVQVKNWSDFASCATDIASLEQEKKDIDAKEKRFLSPVKLGVMAVFAIVTCLFYWKYYKVM